MLDQLKSLWQRRQGGEKVKVLAEEAGLTPQKLVAEFRKLDVTAEDEGGEATPVAVTDDVPVVATAVESHPVAVQVTEPELTPEEREIMQALVAEAAAQKPTPTPSASAATSQYPPLVARPSDEGWRWVKLVAEGQPARWLTKRHVASLQFLAAGNKSLPSDVTRALAKKGLVVKTPEGTVLSPDGHAWLALVPSTTI